MKKATLWIEHTQKDEQGRVDLLFASTENTDNPDFWIGFETADQIDPILRVLFSARKLLSKPDEPDFQMEMDFEEQESC